MRVKTENEKKWLKTQHSKNSQKTFKHSKNKDHVIWSHHFMANRWGKKWKQWQSLFWGGSKITVDGDCSHEI